MGSFVLEYVQTWTLQMTGQRIMYDMRLQIYRHLQRIDLQFYDRNPVGRLMTRVTTDVDVINDMFTSGVVSIFGDIFTLAGIMIVLVTMDWRLALVTFAVLPLIVLVTQWFRRNVRESYRTVRAWVARINAFLQEHITGMSTVQLFRREARTFERFDDINRRHRDANIDSILFYAVFYPAIEVIGALAAALIIWFGGALDAAGHADARVARRVPALFGPILPPDQRHVGEVQRPPGGDGLVRADFQTARHGRSGSHRDSRCDRARDLAVRDRAGTRPDEARYVRRDMTPDSRHDGCPVRETRVANPEPRALTATSSSTTCGSRTTPDDPDGPRRGAASRLRPARRVLRGPARRAGRRRRRDGRGEVDAHQPAAAVLRRHPRAASSWTASTSARWT